MKLAGWGRFPLVETQLTAARDLRDLKDCVATSPLIARGNGRGYGDCAASPHLTVDMRLMNRMLAFDQNSGILEAEAGVLLSDIIATFLPRGWFPYVTPGTKFVTLGGMIAADVHGKNHHKEGGFGRFVEWIDVLGPDGEMTRCTATSAPELFEMTLGGMGLTGLIVRAAIRLRAVETGWIRQQVVVSGNLEATFEAIDASSSSLYSASWIDCLAQGASLGRSLLYSGEHACAADLSAGQAADRYALAASRSAKVPLDFPGWLLNHATVRAFNFAYFNKGRLGGNDSLIGWNPFFYPLDRVLEWNRIYGRNGFLQFQCVLPVDASRSGMRSLIETISRSGEGSFLAVLKRLGPQAGCCSFPMEGYTLALDFRNSPRVFELLEKLDRIVLDCGGRFYLAKDARMSRQTLTASDPRTERFRSVRRKNGWAARFVSAQSQRLDL
jgi:FAD/FMN-containing dehydrogenase